ncbi:MAG: PIF1 family DEAD/DEAH box helicase [Oligoflexia bacterium]|nr:PIF1 family DEAD/DEAH box helicase [Oligoflexia bacterium]
MEKSALNSCQLAALELLSRNDNVFVTGIAGSGKSFLIRHFLRNFDQDDCPVLASTGAAAVLVGGRTFHSFFGLGIMQGGLEATIERATSNKRVVRRLEKTKKIVIDEVSMLSGLTLRAAEEIAREARGSDLPWGGMQVIAVGDFAQLPPVSQSGIRDWAFLDPAWERSHLSYAMLKTSMRTQDEEFLSILNSVRRGHVDEKVKAYLDARVASEATQNEFEGTRLFPHRETVERFNLSRLEAVQSPLHEFVTEYFGEPKFVEDLKKSGPLPEVLRLKKGAWVMLRQNDPMQRWVNGTLGRIESIDADRKKLRVSLMESGYTVEIERCTFNLLDAEGKEVASSFNFPVNLAYATTIHKSQGMTLDRVLVDLRNLWEPGQAYVAMSRVKTGAGLSLTGWTRSSIKMDAAVANFYQRLN